MQPAAAEILYFALRTTKVIIGCDHRLSSSALAIVGPILRPGDPDALVGPLGQPPSAQYWFGTTIVRAGRLRPVRATASARRSSSASSGAGSPAIIGLTVGFVAGYRGGVVDEILSMLTNVVLVIPTLALLLVVAAYLTARGLLVEALFIGLTSWPWAARAIRAQTFTLSSRDFVGPRPA